MTLVVDASVACKWLVEEEGSAQAVKILELDVSLLSPDFIVTEVCSVLWKKHRRDEISREHADAALDSLPGFFDELVPSAVLANMALDITLALGHPVYDSFYLALAQLRNCQMITADKKLLARLAGTEWAGLATGIEQVETGP